MNDKFEKVPVEKDTKILSSTVAQYGQYDVRYEKWSWDGVLGQSLIFFNPDIEGVELDTLQADVQQLPLVEKGSEITVKKGEVYTVFSFNFEQES
ncbi:MAG: hypothetical protein DRR42_03485 [Gammaproteobacteria bacterium]|nr:MAG: hypothetical protein DRR42_03485 [Gammaproteobacteria bacterium]